MTMLMIACGLMPKYVIGSGEIPGLLSVSSGRVIRMNEIDQDPSNSKMHGRRPKHAQIRGSVGTPCLQHTKMKACNCWLHTLAAVVCEMMQVLITRGTFR